MIAGKGTLELPGVKVVQEVAMVICVDADRCGVRIVKGPADVIVTA